MDTGLSHSISTFFDQLFQFILAFIVTPFILIFCLVAFILYQVFKASREDKIRKQLYERLSLPAGASQSQRGAVRAIKIIFDYRTKRYLKYHYQQQSFKDIDDEISAVRELCREHNLPSKFVEHFIDSYIALMNTRDSNEVYVKLTTKYQR